MKVDNLNLNSTKIKLTYTNILGITTVTGSLSATVSYNNATFGLETTLPPTDGSKGPIFAAWISDDDTLDLTSMLGSGFPTVECMKAPPWHPYPKPIPLPCLPCPQHIGASSSVIVRLSILFTPT